MNKEKIITKKDVIAAVERAFIYRNAFSASHSFDPYNLMTGGSGYPDASPLEVKLFEANGDFLDDILKAMEKRENAYNLNLNNAYNLNLNNDIYCTWKREEA